MNAKSMQAEWLETSDLERFRHELEGEALVRMFDFWLDGLSGEVPPQKKCDSASQPRQITKEDLFV